MRFDQSFVLGSALLASACTFGANDFKVVPAGGSSNSTGGITGNGGNAGNSTSTGGGGAGTAGGAGGTAPSITCANQGNPLTIFYAADLFNTEPQGVVIASGVDAAFAVTAVNAPNANPPSVAIVIRGLSDSTTSPLRGLATYMPTGYSRIGGVWATATEITILAADDAGIFQLVVPIRSGDPDQGAMVRTGLFTPPPCTNAGNGHIRDLRGSNDGGLRYIVTCEPNDNSGVFTMWRGVCPAATCGAAGQGQVGTADTAIDRIVRGYISHGLQDLIQCGADGPDVSVQYRLGSTLVDLATVSEMKLSNTGFSTAMFRQFPDGAGAFVLGATITDPTTIVPAELWAGGVGSAQYRTLNQATPPSQLKRIATYTASADLLYPTDMLLVGNPPAMRAFIGQLDFIPKRHIYVTPLAGDGTPLAAPYLVYSPTDTTVQVGPPSLGHAGIGLIVAWPELGEVRARGVLCL